MKRFCYLIALTLMSLVLCGCDDGDGGNSGPAEGVDLTGKWQGMSSDQVSFTADIVQQPNGALAGSIRRQEGYTGSISGQVRGYGFAMHVIWTYGGTGDYEGDVVGNSIEGTCVERTGMRTWRGTFTAFRQ